MVSRALFLISALAHGGLLTLIKNQRAIPMELLRMTSVETADALAPDVRVIAPWRTETFRRRFPGRSQMIDYCRQNGIPVISEIEFAGRFTRAMTVCITGSNGKTTTKEMIASCCRAAQVSQLRFEPS